MGGVEALDAALLGLLGLMVGSFLNVVIHRLPKMMEMRWAAECAELTQTSAPTEPLQMRHQFNLMVPRSRCPHCGHAIQWFENIPARSYLVLGGRCRSCRVPISPRYPARGIVDRGLVRMVRVALGPDLDGGCMVRFLGRARGLDFHRLGHHAAA